MKMLTRDDDTDYLASIASRLESKGIPACIQGTEVARMITPKVVFEPSLWVYLDEQFEDAVRLMDDPEFQPTSGIDVEHFYANLPSETELSSVTFQFLLNALAVGFLGILAVYVFLQIVEG